MESTAACFNTTYVPTTIQVKLGCSKQADKQTDRQTDRQTEVLSIIVCGHNYFTNPMHVPLPRVLKHNPSYKFHSLTVKSAEPVGTNPAL